MRKSNSKIRSRSIYWSMALVLTFSVLTTVAGSRPARPAMAGITVVNNSGLEVRHLYLSAVDQDNWGDDQLNNSSIASGASFTLSGVCSEGSIKVIAEDQNGCFFYKTVSCSADSTWTIASDATPDCGNN